MTRIDVTQCPTITLSYFDRVEKPAPGWRCKHCELIFPDQVAFGPPMAHDCKKLVCAWCRRHDPKDGAVSHGICPAHFVEALSDRGTIPS